MSAAGLILAAGESRRMGSPKALLEYRGKTFLDHQVSLLSTVCAPVIVVLGHRAEEIRTGLRGSRDALFVVNADYPLGQLSSMQCGLRAVPPDAVGVLITLVDHPAAGRDTIARLVQSSAPVAIPRYKGRRGHPIYISRPLIAEFLALPPHASARDGIGRHAAEIEYVDVEDPGILLDIDDPDAYRQLMESQ